MNIHTMIDQLRDWADALERGEELKSLIAGIREVAADIEREDKNDPWLCPSCEVRGEPEEYRNGHYTVVCKNFPSCDNEESWLVEETVEGTLLCEGENDYRMKDDAETAWVLVRNIAVYIKKVDEGVAVDLYVATHEDDDEGLLSSAHALFADATPEGE
jgi:hypothetical protein